jgi:uncharacterized protein with GYD domain
MAKYLFMGYYTDVGLDGLIREGGTMRRDAVAKALESLGGSLEAFYYAFGDADVVCIADLPDNVDATVFSLLVTAARGVTVRTTVLLEPEELDKASEKTLDYRPPGH